MGNELNVITKPFEAVGHGIASGACAVAAGACEAVGEKNAARSCMNAADDQINKSGDALLDAVPGLKLLIKELTQQIETQQSVVFALNVDFAEIKIDETAAKEDYECDMRQRRLKLQRIKKKMKEARDGFKANQKRITDVINHTSVDEGSIPQLLNLINNGLLGATVNNACEREKLNAKLSILGEMLDRRTSTTMFIESVFPQRLQKYVPYLQKKGYVYLKDVLCDNDSQFNGIVKVIKDGLIADHKDPLDPKNKGKKHPLIKKLYRICMRKEAEKLIQSKKDNTKDVLNALSPLYGEFFGGMDIAVTDAHKYLEYNTNAEYNNDQERAIKMSARNAERVRVKTRQEEKENVSEIAQISAADLENDDLQIVLSESRALLNAALVELHSIDSMMAKFVGDEIKKSGFTLAKEVKNCCLYLIESESTMLSSIFIVEKLFKMKPEKPSAKAHNLWKAIEGGINNIVNDYKEMSTMSAKYFAFFCKFKNAFFHYLKCYSRDGDNVDLDVAMEYLKRDIVAYKTFSAEMQERVDVLTKDAQKVIKDCVEQTAGAEQFEIAKRRRAELEKKLREATKNMENALFEVDQAIKGDAYRDWQEQSQESKKLKKEIDDAEGELERLEKERNGKEAELD